MKKKSLLVVAAHPDDEVLGCGGTLIKYKKDGYKINIIFFTDGEGSRDNRNIKDIKKRRSSAIKSSSLLGCKNPIFFNFPDNQLDKVPRLEIVKKIELILEKTKPEIIFTHFNNDLNIDHQIISKATITACRPQIKYVKKILFFEIPSSTEWQITKNNKAFNPNWFEDISEVFNKKIKAIKFYKTEIKKAPHPRSLEGIKSLAKWRGSTICVKYAEAFVLGRKI